MFLVNANGLGLAKPRSKRALELIGVVPRGGGRRRGGQPTSQQDACWRDRRAGRKSGVEREGEDDGD